LDGRGNAFALARSSAWVVVEVPAVFAEMLVMVAETPIVVAELLFGQFSGSGIVCPCFVWFFSVEGGKVVAVQLPEANQRLPAQFLFFLRRI
jgi:hypothetical protein